MRRMQTYQKGCGSVVENKGSERPLHKHPRGKRAGVEKPLGRPIGALVAVEDLGSFKHEGAGCKEHSIARKEAVPDC